MIDCFEDKLLRFDKSELAESFERYFDYALGAVLFDRHDPASAQVFAPTSCTIIEWVTMR